MASRVRSKNRKFIDFSTNFSYTCRGRVDAWLQHTHCRLLRTPKSLTSTTHRERERAHHIGERKRRNENSNFPPLNYASADCGTTRVANETTLKFSLSFHRHGDPKWVNIKISKENSKNTPDKEFSTPRSSSLNYQLVPWATVVKWKFQLFSHFFSNQIFSFSPSNFADIKVKIYQFQLNFRSNLWLISLRFRSLRTCKVKIWLCQKPE